ncbi:MULTISPECIES: DUF5677 domain-containing protein [unclassified Arthrobacter]|uniref:DUF5677 domain-containing protein n=1 Tax=unclassified Arthrobacter TaxID=235627 RepID=UPI0004842A1A|nr:MULTISPECIES: DUF5677 domain-containing protein [unclassified Arthrobacter]
MSPRLSEEAKASMTAVGKLIELQAQVIERARRDTLRHNPPSELGRFDRAVFERAVSVLHAVYVLAAAGHWETANAPVRQLFELLVNMEYLVSCPDRELAAIRFMQFGSLQEALGILGELELAHARGRKIPVARLLQAKSALDNPDYAQFKTTGANGQTRWAKSWSGKNIRELSAASPSELRMVNYQTLFSTWSEQAHAAPGALVRGIISSVFPERPYLSDEAAETEAVVAMSIVQFLELWKLLPQAPELEESVRSEWLIRLQALMAIRRADGGPLLIEMEF